LPAITGYEIELLTPEGETQRYRARFSAGGASVSLVTSWKPVLGQWKVVDFTEVSFTPGEDTPA
jgi:hypothetical protein